MNYMIRPGDTLSAIARRYGISLNRLLTANPQIQNPALLYPGQRITIPAPGAPSGTFRYTVRPGDTFYRIARRFRVSIEALAAANPQLVNPGYLVPGQVLSIPQRRARQYTIQPGDTLYHIARRFGVTVHALLRANPGLNTLNLQVGQTINLPTPVRRAIVAPRAGYGYDEMMADLDALQRRYPFIEVTSIGDSVLGRPIPAVRIGIGPREVHYNASFHANEWITTPLLMKFLEVYADAYEQGRRIGEYFIPDLFNRTSLWLVPMVNPDGVELVLEGISPENPYYEEVLAINGGSRNFDRWTANIRGVDLNNQFPAGWEREVARKPKSPAPAGYPGPSPLSEPESQAMADFTRAHDFRLVIAFHSQGKVIFWGYEGLEPPESERIVNIFATASGYRPIRYIESWAGYKDWFIQEWRRPGFTVEVGRGINPLPIDQFWEIWGENIGILMVGLAV